MERKTRGKYIRTLDIKKKMSESHKGKPKSKQHRMKISLGLLGIVPWNKGKRGIFSEESLKKISNAQKGHSRKHTLETKIKIGKGHKGMKYSEDTKRKMSDAKKGKKSYLFGLVGEKHPAWKGKGAKTPTSQRIRQSYKYGKWRDCVFERDNWTCVRCNSKEKIEADHIKPFVLFPELRFAIDNGRTLCRNCHIERHFRGSNE